MNQRYYFHMNHLGSTTLVTNELGGATGERLVYPWGDRWAEAGAYIPPQCAAFRDTVPGTADIYVTEFRHYMPGQFRWLSPGPVAGDILNPQSLNRYAYVLNNPTNFIDPLGLCGETWTSVSGYTDAFGYHETERSSGSNGPCPDVLFHMNYWLTRQPILPSYVPPRPPAGSDQATDTEPLDVSKTWSETFACGQNATDLMSTVQSDFSRFANFSGNEGSAVFQPGPISEGQTFLIDTQVSSLWGYAPGQTNAVVVNTQTPNGWQFTTVPGRHFIDGTVTFMASDAGGARSTS